MSAHRKLCTASVTLLAAGFTAGMITAAAAGSLGGPLELQDEGVFFVNGQAAATAFPDSPATGAAPPVCSPTTTSDCFSTVALPSLMSC